MSGQIPEAIIQEVRQAADIVEIVSEAVVLKQSGKNMVGLCPFHSEKTPSFNVNPGRQIFHCFGCGEGGDVFAFVMRHQGLNFPEAVKALAARYGIRLPAEGSGVSPGADMRGRLRAVNQEAMVFFGRMLADPEQGAAARAYLQRRGLNADTIAAFHLGWAPAAWDRLIVHLRAGRFPLPLMEQAGLVVPRRSANGFYDRFRERIIFPILDVDGTVAGFGGRVIGDGLPKYLNSPETPLYNKRRCLYGLHQARQACRTSQAVFIVEGYLDLLALHQNGIRNAVATLGTALTVEQIILLKRFVGSGEIILVFDGDAAGQKAAERTRPIFEQLHSCFGAGSFKGEVGINTRIMELPEGQDPDDFLRTHGPDDFRARAASAKGMVAFLIDAALRQHGNTIEGRALAVGELAEPLRAVEDPVTRALYVKLLAERVGVEEAVILRRIGKIRSPSNAASTDAAAAKPARMPPLERQVTAMMMQFPSILSEVDKRRLTSYFTNLRLKKIADTVLALFHKTGRVDDLIENLSDPELQRMASRLMMGEEQWTEAGCLKLMGQFELAGSRRRDTRLTDVKEAERGADAESLERVLREIHLAAKRKDRSKQRLMKR